MLLVFPSERLGEDAMGEAVVVCVDRGGQSAPTSRGGSRPPAGQRNEPFRRVAAILGCLALATTATTACAAAGGETAVIRQTELVGEWSNTNGARAYVSVDRGFAVSGIEQAVPDYGCSASVTTYTWNFMVPTGPHSAAVSESATEGESLAVSAGTDDASCDIRAQVQRDGQGFNICLVRDLDQGCTADELLRKDSPPARPTR
ncbi:hypothetical protein [Streptomyces erythrochromogenes]|uniref:hypothetical protein n=1 Tax=Streptomyces erythrochromogenes TaxID=285574 RepID=UPI00367615C3